MSYLRDQNEDDVLAGKEHELTLSTAAIFAIFFGLVALCGIFFGFGYSLGSHKSPAVATTGSSAQQQSANFGAFKPAAGQPLGSANKPSAAVPASSAYSATASAIPAKTAIASTREDAADPPVSRPTQPAPIVRVTPAPAESVHPITLPQAAAPAAAGLVVQVAAISLGHPDDVTRMVNALKGKGYAVFTRSGPDAFTHVLVGPFSNRPAAEAMVQRLSADGYTTYIK